MAELEKKISTGIFIDEELVDNDKDLRAPSPEPIYDPRSGQRLNKIELRIYTRIFKTKKFINIRTNSILLYI